MATLTGFSEISIRVATLIDFSEISIRVATLIDFSEPCQEYRVYGAQHVEPRCGNTLGFRVVLYYSRSSVGQLG